MIRSVAAVLAILNHVAPHYQPKEATAALLVEEGRRRHFDPYTLIAIVEHESHWHPGATNGKAFGLSQVMSTNFKSCQRSRDSDQCKAVEQVLIEWKFNLDFAALLIEENREYCKRVVGTDLAVYWLQQFQGFGATRGTTCGHVKKKGKWVAVEVPEMTKWVLQRRRELSAL